jgi:hypothetical protein
MGSQMSTQSSQILLCDGVAEMGRELEERSPDLFNGI